MKNFQNYQRAIEDNLLIVDKNKIEIPFILNKAQKDFLERASNRNVILKSRKMGFSSVLLAVGLMKWLFGRNERIVSMSFDKGASAKQLERVKRFLQAYERINKVDIQKSMKYNSKYEMVLEVPASKDPKGEGYTNTLRIGTAKSTGFGRGDDVTFLHLTEVSLADHLDELLAGVGEAVVNDAMISLETTANGYNQFKTFWDEAAADMRGYTAFFYGPEWEYSDEYLLQKEKELGRLFKQEYPRKPQDAFITSGDTYFDNIALQDLLAMVSTPKQVVKC